jgi:dTDP-4-dehydrorhamnose reductase
VEEDPIAPLSVYGRTKAAGEQAVLASGLERCFVLRTQWVYGPGGRCFPAAILAKVRAGERLQVVDDQVGAPTMTDDVAAATLDLLVRFEAGRAAPGLYHVASRGALSWFAFARLILAAAGVCATIEPIASTTLGLPAPRPAYSVLDAGKLERTLGRPMPSVESGLRRYLEAEGIVKGGGRNV